MSSEHPVRSDGRPYSVSYHSYYRLRCRCSDCRAWNAKRQREKSARRRQAVRKPLLVKDVDRALDAAIEEFIRSRTSV